MTTGDGVLSLRRRCQCGGELLLIGPLSDRADALFTHLDDDPPSRFSVSDLFFSVCTNIL